MLNYIWAGLIIFSLLFAIINDVRDLANDTYRNGQSLPVVIDGSGENVTVRVDAKAYAGFYGVAETLPAEYSATLVQTPRGPELRFPATAALPPRLAKIRDMTSAADPKWLLAQVTERKPDGAAAIRFQQVRWTSMQAISAAALAMAKEAVTLAIGLVGTLALFLGIMQIA
ncbi:MAG: spore maturation protein, partial [Humisphaera sp.]|nr:spore maturation protein [Humisphaera sp.]